MQSDCRKIKNTYLSVLSFSTHSDSMAILDCFVVLFFLGHFCRFLGQNQRVSDADNVIYKSQMEVRCLDTTMLQKTSRK